MTCRKKIEPHRITKPFQLLAAWLTGLVLVDGAFLWAAAEVDSPSWVSPLLAIAAVLNVPLFLFCIFRLQTKFRPEMQADEYYSRYLEQKQREVEQVAQDVYAKADVIREAVEQIGELSAFALRRVGRSVGRDFFKELYSERYRLADLLKRIGIDEERVPEIVSRVDEMIAIDMARVVDKEVRSALRAVRDPYPKGHEIILGVRKTLCESQIGHAEEDLRTYLSSLPDEAWNENIKIFALEDGTPIVNTHKLRDAMRDTLTAAELPPIRPHDLRHTFGLSLFYAFTCTTYPFCLSTTLSKGSPLQ